jgi:simple sugar transport system ATP-binding protein
MGIGLVQQHFSLIPTLTAAENLVLALRGSGQAPGRAQARALLVDLGERYGLPVEADVPVERLSVSQRQRIEVLKALASDVTVLALDEPNALLTPQEWSQLAQVLRELAMRGVAVLLISHKLDDVLQLADRVSVLRRGRVVATRTVSTVDAAELGALMIGTVVPAPVTATEQPTGRVVLDVRDLHVDGADRHAVRGVDLELRAGEVVGLAGVEGSGQVELSQALVGVRRPRGGRILHDGVDVTHDGPGARQRAGVGHVPADRHAMGLVPALTVAENLLLPELGRRGISAAGLLSRRAMRARAQALVAEFDIRVAGPDVPAGSLSGGNQQKVVLARELSRRPDLLVCCDATRGLDFAAADAVKRRVLEARAAGASVLYSSVDLDELVELCDRIVVMNAGQIVGQLNGSAATAESLGALMGGRRAA